MTILRVFLGSSHFSVGLTRNTIKAVQWLEGLKEPTICTEVWKEPQFTVTKCAKEKCDKDGEANESHQEQDDEKTKCSHSGIVGSLASPPRPDREETACNHEENERGPEDPRG